VRKERGKLSWLSPSRRRERLVSGEKMESMEGETEGSQDLVLQWKTPHPPSPLFSGGRDGVNLKEGSQGSDQKKRGKAKRRLLQDLFSSGADLEVTRRKVPEITEINTPDTTPAFLSPSNSGQRHRGGGGNRKSHLTVIPRERGPPPYGNSRLQNQQKCPKGIKTAQKKFHVKVLLFSEKM